MAKQPEKEFEKLGNAESHRDTASGISWREGPEYLGMLDSSMGGGVDWEVMREDDHWEDCQRKWDMEDDKKLI